MNDNLPAIPAEWDDPPRAQRWLMYGHRSDPHKLTFYFYDRAVSEPGGQIVAAVAVGIDLAHTSAQNLVHELGGTRGPNRNEEDRSLPAVATQDDQGVGASTSEGADRFVMVGDRNIVNITIGDKNKTVGDKRRWMSGRRGVTAVTTGAVAIGGAMLELLRRGSIWPF